DFYEARRKNLNLKVAVEASKAEPNREEINKSPSKDIKVIKPGASKSVGGGIGFSNNESQEMREILSNSTSRFYAIGGSITDSGAGWSLNGTKTAVEVELGEITELIDAKILKSSLTQEDLNKYSIRDKVAEAVRKQKDKLHDYENREERAYEMQVTNIKITKHIDDADKRGKGFIRAKVSGSDKVISLFEVPNISEGFNQNWEVHFLDPNERNLATRSWHPFFQVAGANGQFPSLQVDFSAEIWDSDHCCGDELAEVKWGQFPTKPLRTNESYIHKMNFKDTDHLVLQDWEIEVTVMIRPVDPLALERSSNNRSASTSPPVTVAKYQPPTVAENTFRSLTTGDANNPPATNTNTAVNTTLTADTTSTPPKDDFIDLNGTYYITDAKHNKSLVTGMVYGGGVYHQTPRNSPVDASWYFLPTGDGYYYIYDLRFNKALVGPDYYDHLGGGTHFVYHQDPNGRTNAQWKITPSGMPGKYIITDRKHDKSMVAGDVADNNIYLQSHNNRLNAYWTFTATKDKAPAVKPDPNPTPPPTASTTPVTTKPATNTLAPASAGLVRIMSIMGFNNYLHHQNNKPENGQIQADWSSSQWRLVPVEGGLVRIQSSVHPDKYLHIQNGPLELGTIDLNWASALWKIVPAQAGVIRIQSSLHPDKYFYPLGNDVVVDVVDFNSYSGPVVSSMWKIEGEIPTTASNTPTETVPATTAAAANTMTPASPGYVRIQNYWKKTHYVHNENGTLEDGLIQPNWWSSQWKIVPVHSGWVRIQNKWKPDQYLHNQNGKLEVGTIEPNWASAMWKLVPASQDGWVRIQNSWYQNQYIHNQNGKIEVGEIDTNWGSALWKVE
ncbi:MAG: RICIN domain-containing protein, partial [Saprospiraceae bacterium]|nr:RICIN domain-containing protein [Saprospiraceae bacterium]